ncbi:condensation domain-containing protein, partial [Pseudomonas sp. dw_612]|uniref:condensation domain-containing protein n=1 Tax=Pseudomonas sp. dw_612 TaxID=2720080 RepID=UPI0021170A5D
TVNPPRRLEHAPIFQAMLAWQNTSQTELVLPGLEVQPLDMAYPVSKYDVELNLAEQGGEIVGVLVYATALFDAATMVRHLGYLQAMLRAMVADPGQTVERIALLSASERQLLLETWNQTGA